MIEGLVLLGVDDKLYFQERNGKYRTIKDERKEHYMPELGKYATLEEWELV